MIEQSRKIGKKNESYKDSSFLSDDMRKDCNERKLTNGKSTGFRFVDWLSVGCIICCAHCKPVIDDVIHHDGVVYDRIDDQLISLVNHDYCQLDQRLMLEKLSLTKTLLFCLTICAGPLMKGNIKL